MAGNRDAWYNSVEDRHPGRSVESTEALHSAYGSEYRYDSRGSRETEMQGLKHTSSYEPLHEAYYDKRRRLDGISLENPSCYDSESLSRQSFLKHPEDYERSSRDYVRDDRYDLQYHYKGYSESDVGSRVDYGMYEKSADRYAGDSFVSEQANELRRHYSQKKDSGQEYLQKIQKESVSVSKDDDIDEFSRGYYRDSRINRDQHFSQDWRQESYERPQSDKYGGGKYSDSRVNINSSSDLNPEVYGKPKDEFKPNNSSDIDKFSGSYSGSNEKGEQSQYLNAENYKKLKSDDFSSNDRYERGRDYYTDSRIDRSQSQGLDPQKYARSQSEFYQNDNDKYLRTSYTDSRNNRNPCSSDEFPSRVGSTEDNENYGPSVPTQKGDTRNLKQFDNFDMSSDLYVESVSKYGRDVLEQSRFSSGDNPDKGRGRYYMKDQFNDDRKMDDYSKSKNYFETVHNEDNFRGNHRANNSSVVSRDNRREAAYPEVSLKAAKDDGLKSDRAVHGLTFKVSELLDRIKKVDEKDMIIRGHAGERENYNVQKKYNEPDDSRNNRRSEYDVNLDKNIKIPYPENTCSKFPPSEYYDRSKKDVGLEKYGNTVPDKHDVLKMNSDVDSYRTSCEIGSDGRTRSFISTENYERYDKDGQNTYLGADKSNSVLDIHAIDGQETSPGSRNDYGFRKDDSNQSRAHPDDYNQSRAHPDDYNQSRVHANDYNQSRAHADNYNQSTSYFDNYNQSRMHNDDNHWSRTAGSNNFRNAGQNDYDQLRDFNDRVKNLSHEEGSENYSRDGNDNSSDRLVNKRSDYNTVNSISIVQCKISYSGHGDKVEADRYKTCNSLRPHSDASSRRENYVEEHQNLNKQWNKNGQMQSNFYVVTSENTISKNKTLQHNYHDETMLSTNIQSQINNNDKNIEDVEQTDKNIRGAFDQNLSRSYNNTVSSVSNVHCKTSYSEHGDKVQADRYKPSNSLPYHSGASSRRGSYVRYPNLKWNRNSQLQTKFNLVKSENATSKNVTLQRNYHDEITKPLSTNIRSQNNNNGKNNKGVPGQIVKNSRFDQNLQSSDNNNVKSDRPAQSKIRYIYSPHGTIVVPADSDQSANHTREQENKNTDQLYNKCDAIKDRSVVQSNNIQTFNSGVINDCNKGDERGLAASKPAATNSNVTSSTETKEKDKIASTGTSDLGLHKKQEQPIAPLPVFENKALLSDADLGIDDSSEFAKDEEISAQPTEEEISGQPTKDSHKDQLTVLGPSANDSQIALVGQPFGLSFDPFRQQKMKKVPTKEGISGETTKEDMNKFSAVMNKYNISGPFGKMVVLAGSDESPLQTLDRTKTFMRKTFPSTVECHEATKEWVCNMKFGNLTISGVNVTKAQAKRDAGRVFVKKLQEHYYTLLIKKEYYSPGDTVVHVSGQIGPRITRKMVYARERHSVPPDMKKTLECIDEYVKSDAVHDLVFTFMFPPPARKELQNYGRSHGLKVRKFGDRRFRFLVLSKNQSYWKIIEGVDRGDKRYLSNFKLVPPGVPLNW